MAKDTFYYIYIGLAITLIVILYIKYIEKLDKNRHVKHTDIPDDMDFINKYYYKSGAERLAREVRPILWLHIPYEYNSRDWQSFGSRSSFNLNQPYLYITLKSMIMMCDSTFHVCIIDDLSFSKLLPSWKVNLSAVSDPVRSYMRQLAICQLLYKYGGVNMPISFLCMKDLYYIWDVGTRRTEVFTIETVNRDMSENGNTFKANVKFLGSKKNSDEMLKMIRYLEYEISMDYTDQFKFLGKINDYLMEKVRGRKIYMFDSGYIGAKTIDGSAITIDTLMSSEYIDLHTNSYGVYVDMEEMLSRLNYGYFPRMSMRQVCEGTSILSKYMLLSCTDASNKSLNIVKETYDNKNMDIATIINKYVRLWELDGIGQLGETIYGLMPNGIFPTH